MKKSASILSSLLIKIGIVVLVLLIFGFFSLRLDISKGKAYSLGKISKDLVKDMDGILLIKVVSSQELPSELNLLSRYALDLLSEYQAASRGKLRYEIVKPPTQEELLEIARTSGLRRLRFQSYEEDQVISKEVIFGLVFEYMGKMEAMDLMPNIEPMLEYEMTMRIQALVNRGLPKVAVFADSTYYAHSTSYFDYMMRMNFSPYPTDLSEPLKDTDLLLMNGVSGDIEKESLYNLDQYLMKGGKIIFLQDRVNTDGYSLYPIESNIFELLKHYGFEMSLDIALDSNCERRQAGVDSYMFYPMYPIVGGAEHPASKNIGGVLLYLANGISYTDNKGLKYQDILRSSDYSALMEAPDYELDREMYFALDMSQYRHPSILLGAEATGEFESYFAADEEFSGRLGFIAKSLPTSIILFADKELPIDPDNNIHLQRSNVVLNSIDYLCGRQSMIKVRMRHLGVSYLDLGEFIEKHGSIWVDQRKAERQLRTGLKAVFTFLPALLLAIIQAYAAFRRKLKLREMNEKE